MAAAALLYLPCLEAQVSVVTQHSDNARTGQNLNETILTPANVNSNSFGKLFSQPVDGYVYAQPLYVPNVNISGKGTHNVVFVATEHDSVYAFDADTNGGIDGLPLWHASMLDTSHGAASGATTVPSSMVSTSDIVPEIGISGTPVIDVNSGTLYVVSKTVENSYPVQRLHALDITTGNEKAGSPVTISASVSGTGNGSSNGVLNFDPKWAHNRAGLLLLNGTLYIAFGSHGDNGPWHGWLLAYNASTLKQTGVFCPTANGIGGGFWASGNGLAADLVDPNGRLFMATGNGSFNATTPYGSGMNFSDDELRLNLSGGALSIADAFTPYNQQQLNQSDLDLGSGGTLLLPDQSAGGHAHLLVVAGKGGTIYLVDRDNLGGYDPNTNHVVQELDGQIPGFWGAPAYWNNHVYFWAPNDSIKAFGLSNGQLTTTPALVGSEVSAYPGSTPTISANGNRNGIAWVLRTDGYVSGNPAILEAYDATALGSPLYTSNQNAARDNPGTAIKFTVPTVVNGKVYAGTQNQVSIYGLLNSESQAATPVITPGSESFTGTVQVTISDATSGASIYYTTDGSTPTEASTLYTGPIQVSGTTTINAIASLTGSLRSAVASATYSLQTQTAAPTFAPAAGSYTSAQSITISDATPNATIYYTTDGSTPTTSSPVYSGPINVTASEKISAMAVASGLTASQTRVANYSIQNGASGINFGNGFSSSAQTMTFNGSTGLDDSRLQLTNGGTYEAGSAFYKTAMNIQAFTADFTFQLSNAQADGFTFTIQGNGATALGGSGAGLGFSGIGQSVAIKFDLYNNAGEGGDSTGLYTNGATPTTPSIDLSNTGIDLHSGDTMAVHLTYDGATLAMQISDDVANTSYSTQWSINLPATIGSNSAYIGFTGGSGGLSASQKIETWTFVSATPTATPSAPNPPSSNGLPGNPVTIVAKLSGKCLDDTNWSTQPNTTLQQWACASQTNQQWQLKANSDGSYNIVSVYSGLSVAVGADGSSDGNPVTQVAYTGTKNQNWYIASTQDGYYQITSQQSGKCLDVSGGTSAVQDGDTMEQWGCWGGDNQKFRITGANGSTTPPTTPPTTPSGSGLPTGKVKILGKASGRALDVTSESTQNGALIEQWDYWGGANQQWTLTANADGTYHVLSVGSGLALELVGGTGATSNGGSVDQWQYWGGTNQNWYFKATPDGYYQIVAENSGNCLDISGSSTANGALLQQWACWGGDNQKFQVVPVQ